VCCALKERTIININNASAKGLFVCRGTQNAKRERAESGDWKKSAPRKEDIILSKRYEHARAEKERERERFDSRFDFDFPREKEREREARARYE
jgi:hypothetical protein